MAFKVTKDVLGDEQESSFMNATQSLHGQLSVSIAVRMPDQVNGSSQDEIAAKLKADLQHLVDQGYDIEVQIGPDNEPEE